MFLRSDNLLLTGSGDSTCAIWDVESGQVGQHNLLQFHSFLFRLYELNLPFEYIFVFVLFPKFQRGTEGGGLKIS